MDRSTSAKEVQEAAARRRRLTILLFVVLGAIVLCLVACIGYFAYRKINDDTSCSSKLTNTAGLPAAQTTQISILTSHRSSKTQTMNPSTATESITLSKTTNEQSTAYATGNGLTSSTRVAGQSPVGVTKGSSLTSNEQTTTVTSETSDKLTSKLSTLHSSTDVISSNEPETTAQTSTEQTTTVGICFLYTSTESNGTLPAAASGIHPDTCANITTDMCNNDAENVSSFCECDNEGVWTIIQRRFDGCVDFYRNWTEYKEGFGNINGEYWLGIEAMHEITSNAAYTLKVVLTDWNGATKYAKYNTFTIADEADGYRLTLGSYSGTAGNSMNYNNGHQFSTWDRDNDGYTDVSCAQAESSAWWHNHCTIANLNGPYLHANARGIFWYHWNGWNYSFKETKMMIKIA